MEKRISMIIASLFLCVGMAMAQITVRGTIIAADDGEPLPGASVRVVGATAGTTTNIDGQFTITVPNAESRLQISHIGMLTRVVRARNGMQIALDTDESQLDEVMVVAYGTQKRSSFTGAATTIKSEKIEGLQVSDLGKALEGQVAGVQISSVTGTPGSTSTIVVRGVGSISAGIEPLIIMDGVPYDGSLNSIPTHDIESLTILKDAAANSMYGARGANGVILITTKSAKAGKPRVEFSGRWGFNARAVGDYDIIKNPGEYYEMAWEAMRNLYSANHSMAEAAQMATENLIDGPEGLRYNIFQGVANNAIVDPLTGHLTAAAEAAATKWSDDWTKDPYENGFRQEYNVTVSGGNSDSKLIFSAGYLGDEGYVVNSGFDRFNARVKADQKVNDFIRAGANIGYVRTNMKTYGSDYGGYASDIFYMAQHYAPIYPLYLYDNNGVPQYDADGNRLYDFGETVGMARPIMPGENPVALAEKSYRRTMRDNLTTRGFLEIKFLKDFTLTGNVSYDLFNTTSANYQAPLGGAAKTYNGIGVNSSRRYGTLNVNEILDWAHTFGNHGLHVMLVHENKNTQSKGLTAEGCGFLNFDNHDLYSASTIVSSEVYSTTTEYAFEGYLAKAEYDFKDRYYLTASIRRDASSQFDKDHRWGNFWAVGGAWRINEEPFMKNVKWVNNLKLKASYGTQGNLPSGAHLYYNKYGISRISDGETSVAKATRGNPDLTWEKQGMFNVGIEALLWNRLTVNADFFIKTNKDLIFYSPLPPSEGAPSGIYRNEMDMKNTGFEFEVGYDIIKTHDVRWNIALNGTHYKNEITKLPDSKPEEEYPDGFYRSGNWWKKGGSMYQWAGYEYVGVNPENGKPQYNVYVDDLDAEGNKLGTKHVEVVSDLSSVEMYELKGKSLIPDLQGGISTSVEAYGVDFSLATTYQIGGWVRDTGYSSLMSATNSQGGNYHRDIFNRWTTAHTNTDIPQVIWGGSSEQSISSYSDFYLTKASYFSIKNITLGYTLPQKWTRKAQIERLRVYLTGDNVWLKSKRQGFDPRTGYDYSESYEYAGDAGMHYNALSSYSIGLDLTF